PRSASPDVNADPPRPPPGRTTMSNASIIPTHWPPGTPDTVDDLDEAVEALQADLARDVVERDRANQPPFDEVRRLRKSGLLLLPLDASLGGPGRGLP